MDEFLNELYGTSSIINGGDDLEKQAAAEFLIKLAEQEGVDLDTLSDAEVGQLLSEIEGDMGKEAQVQQPTGEQEAQEKLAEADFLGRAMAHAYVNELHEIEKSAADEMVGPQIGKARLGYRRAAAAAGRAGGAAGEATGVSKIVAGLKKMKGTSGGKIGGPDVAAHLKGLARQEGKTALTQGLKRFGKRVALPAAALTAAAYGAKKAFGSEKKSFNEEFEDMARERAYEMLAEAGYDIEKVAQADVETRALQMLEQAGYPVNWNQK